MSESEIGFEQAMEQLEEIVTKLEKGDLPLEYAIDLFQEGMRLSRLCNQKLESVERKIDILLEEEGAWVKKPFISPEEKGENT
jgi:exodeoxyribonuclease VII small subunit